MHERLSELAHVRVRPMHAAELHGHEHVLRVLHVLLGRGHVLRVRHRLLVQLVVEPRTFLRYASRSTRWRHLVDSFRSLDKKKPTRFFALLKMEF